MAKSKLSIRERFDSKWTPEPFSGCWLWTSHVDAKGYGMFDLYPKQGKRAHRLSWELNRGAIPSGMCVLHRCDTPCCVNPDHLFLGTIADNNHDCEAKGRRPHGRGEQIGTSVLTEAQVREIKTSTESSRKLGRRFGVSKTPILQIRSGKSWAHVG